MKEKHFFAGNNTSKGFFSYFDNSINPSELNRIYILKGGPGVGKSSFMKKFCNRMKEKDFSIEYIHCSSDNNSLDGVIIPEIKIAFVDGTAPHTIDPKIPGVVDEIVNLGAYLDNNQLKKHKSQIIQINEAKSQLYKSAYRYLKSAGIVFEEINSIYDKFTDKEKFESVCNEAIKKIYPNDLHDIKHSKIKKSFSESYTANGYIKHTNSLCQGKKILAIIGENSNYTSKLLDKILVEGIRKGYDVECFYRPLNPEKLQHLLIPELNLMVISTEEILNENYDEIINLHEIMDVKKMQNHISEIENNLQIFDLLIKNALNKLSETKKQHELLEIFYINSMDFKSVDKCLENILTLYL
ncbi:hypothetical protein [Sedimentibacter sp. MB31-C6]|uniref:hypothetical protein n=1 Tax=Sedimentibacter sp. MB31-C6 TaxID=3109366 RepID=UPI002DDD5B0F|nr:hypothetical protein [Sedimentibacter sp. MB36-C1]WSI02883.1 hypothetical protein U8307_07450 [Sedimentibacter sp. MB36-C1]